MNMMKPPPLRGRQPPHIPLPRPHPPAFSRRVLERRRRTLQTRERFLHPGCVARHHRRRCRHGRWNIAKRQDNPPIPPPPHRPEFAHAPPILRPDDDPLPPERLLNRQRNMLQNLRERPVPHPNRPNLHKPPTPSGNLNQRPACNLLPEHANILGDIPQTCSRQLRPRAPAIV